MNIKTEDFYKDIANDVEKGIIHQIVCEKPLPMGTNV